MVDTSKQTHLKLQNGDQMPQLGLGLWKMPNEQCADVVVNAVEAGYRLFDSAADYGNEKETGEGLKRVFEAGTVKREELFVVSKLWNSHHRPEHVKEAVKKTLADLGLEYLDLYLIHFPIATKYVSVESRYPAGWIFDTEAETPKMELDEGVAYHQTWAALEELVKEGLVKHIGACNINTDKQRDIIRYATVKPSVLQVELHPYLTQEKLVRFAKSEGLQVIAYSNLGAGSYVSLGGATEEESVIGREDIKAIGAKYSKTAAQVVLRWGVQRGTTVIPKTISKERLAENADIFDFELSQEEMDQVSALNTGRRFNDPGVYCQFFGQFCPIFD